MFDFLHSKIEGALSRIRGGGSLTAGDVEEVMKGVRTALLEADVNFRVAKDFCSRLSERAVGESVLKSLTPDQQIIKLVHEELKRVMGDEIAEINLRAAPPIIIMLAGLQGSGKTTTASKLARLMRDTYKRSPLLVPADVYRPAAIDQLKTLGSSLSIPVFDTKPTDKPLDIAIRALDYARKNVLDVVIIDTAGRLQIDTELMNELTQISAAVSPTEILLVADAMTGQEAVNVAQAFDQALPLTGLVLTKLDGDARGGAALSMRAVTGKPIKFIGTGEKADALEPFHPDRMASRILGMGDVLTLIEKAVGQVSLEDSAKLEKKFKRDQFSFEDFLDQLRMIKKMGSISSLMGMIPGLNKIAKQVDPEKQEREFAKIEAIILSMTAQERRDHEILNGSRRRRIALGSGTKVEDVNKLVKQFVEMRKVMKQMMKLGPGGLGGLLGGGGGGGLGGLGNFGGMFGKR
jgi:signal recognition particle subunit SRP54